MRVMSALHRLLLFLLFSTIVTHNTLAAGKRHELVGVPFIYVHGVGAPYQLFTIASSLPKTFQKLGHTLHVAKTPATASIEESAKVLEREVRRLVPKGPYLLLGHSMGGLVARAFLAKSTQATRCRALITVSTPHGGSPVADWALRMLLQGEQQGEQVNDKENSLLSLITQWVGNNVQVLRELSTPYMQQRFPQLYPRREGVRYFSVGHYIPSPQAYYSQIPYLLAAHAINRAAGFELSDGPVPVESAQYGTHLGNFPGDHYATQGPVPFGLSLIYQQSFERLLHLLQLHW